jgi:hypothetical protein
MKFVVPTQAEADELITRLKEVISKFGYVAVGDLHQLLGIPFRYTDEKSGWKDLTKAEVTSVKMVFYNHLQTGYLLTLPDPESLK